MCNYIDQLLSQAFPLYNLTCIPLATRYMLLHTLIFSPTDMKLNQPHQNSPSGLKKIHACQQLPHLTGTETVSSVRSCGGEVGAELTCR